MTYFAFEWKGKPVKIHDRLRRALDSVVYNIKYNPEGLWNANIIITGDRISGTGKSTLTEIMAAYCAFRLQREYGIEDIYFDSYEMIKAAIKKGKWGLNHYDEARRGLVTNKRMTRIQEDLLDYYAECRQLNQINFIVLPDFFKLNEEIAVAQSEFLINVVRERKEIITDIVTGSKEPIVAWGRGTFHFYRRETKRILYDIYSNTRRKDYWAIEPDFSGSFELMPILDDAAYEDKKLKALHDMHKEQEEKKKSKKAELILGRICFDYKKMGLSNPEIVKKLKIDWDYESYPNEILRRLAEYQENEGLGQDIGQY